MAIKKIEISQNALKAVENLGIKISELTNDEFNEKINSLIIAGADRIELSNDNLILLENILKFAKTLEKDSEVQENLKCKLKELHKDLIEAI